MYYEWVQKHKKTIVVSAAIALILFTVWGFVTYTTRIGKVGVTLSAVPRDATVTIDGKKVGSGTHWITPGSYKVVASKDGYAERTKTVIASSEKQQNAVALSLTPVSDEAKKWADAHANDYKANEAYGAIEARANGDYFKLKNPVTNVLPYTDPYYSLGYDVTPDNSILITVATPSPRYRYMAVQKFRDLGFNPSDFHIVFKDFNNPLGNNNEK